MNSTKAKEANIQYVLAKFIDFDSHPATFEKTMPLTIKLYASTCMIQF